MLLHGIGSAARSWVHQLDGLADAFRVVAWDAPGYSDSAPVAGHSPSPEDYVERLVVFLGALGISKAHLVGHSLGAVIAAKFAHLHPSRILTLTLASPSSGQARLPEKERARLRAGRLDDLKTLGPRGMAEKRGPRLVTESAPMAVREAVIETMAQVRPEGYRQAVEMLAAADTRGDLELLPSVMLVQFVYGAADVVTTPQSIRSLAAARPGAPVHEIADAGHAVYLEKPQAFNACLRHFAAGERSFA